MKNLLLMLGLLWCMAAGASERAIDKAVTVAASLDETWAAWTTREGITSFFAPDAKIEPKVGGAFEIYFNPFAEAGMKGADGMRYLALQPQRMISFDWNAPPSLPQARQQRTFVVVRFLPLGDKSTSVKLHHSGWGEGGEWDQAYTYFDRAWASVLANLKKRFDSGPVDWSTWLEQMQKATPASATPPASAAVLSERLFSAIGGRSAWAQLRNTVNDSQQYRVAEPTQVRAVITMDFMQPRWRVDTTAPGLQISRVVDGPSDWRQTREGRIEPLSAATRREDLQWYAGHVYRTLARIARRDSALNLGVGHDGRLEVFEGQQRIAWFKLTATGEPHAFGGIGDGPGSVSGPWTATDQGLHHPAWVASADGSWRSSLNRLQVNVPLADGLFKAPG